MTKNSLTNNTTTMFINRTNNTDHITIGRNAVLTYGIVIAIHDRSVRKHKRKAFIQKLQFWKRP